MKIEQKKIIYLNIENAYISIYIQKRITKIYYQIYIDNKNVKNILSGFLRKKHAS